MADIEERKLSKKNLPVAEKADAYIPVVVRSGKERYRIAAWESSRLKRAAACLVHSGNCHHIRLLPTLMLATHCCSVMTVLGVKLGRYRGACSVCMCAIHYQLA